MVHNTRSILILDEIWSLTSRKGMNIRRPLVLGKKKHATARNSTVDGFRCSKTPLVESNSFPISLSKDGQILRIRSCALHDFHVPKSDLAWHARQQWGGEQKQPGPTDQHDFGNWRWSVGLSLSYDSILFSVLQSSIYPDHLPSRTSGGFQYEQSNANRSSCMSGQRLAIAQITSKYFGALTFLGELLVPLVHGSTWGPQSALQ